VPNENLSPQTYTVRQAAQLLGIGKNSAYEAAARGEIPVVRIGKRLLVPKVALDHMLRESGNAAE
jgi:excisionase family DNA binding protein